MKLFINTLSAHLLLCILFDQAQDANDRMEVEYIGLLEICFLIGQSSHIIWVSIVTLWHKKEQTSPKEFNWNKDTKGNGIVGIRSSSREDERRYFLLW